MRPLIAVPARHVGKTEVEGVRNDVVAAGRFYLEALERAGAEGCVLLPRVADWKEVLARFDGLLLQGGGDVDPARYGQEPAPEVGGVLALHDDMDVACVHAALDLGMPVLAICRGLQVLNVALGGTLVQHLPGPRLVRHEVDVVPGSRTALAMGTTRPMVQCAHHQGLDRLGRGLVVTARNADGGIEGAELEGSAWVVGTQWHPEDTAAADPTNQALFDAFVAACAQQP
jgi:putative glutamine amidotransferase